MTEAQRQNIADGIAFLRQNQLNGYVMQEEDISQVLNAGIQYANGTYITFVFPQRIYQSYLEEFLKGKRNKCRVFVWVQTPRTIKICGFA